MDPYKHQAANLNRKLLKVEKESAWKRKLYCLEQYNY